MTPKNVLISSCILSVLVLMNTFSNISPFPYIRLRSHRISHPVMSGLSQSYSITFSRPGFDQPIGQRIWTYGLIFSSSPSTILRQNFRLIEFRTRISLTATTTHVWAAMSFEGQFLVELIAFASTSFIGAAKVRAAAISIPGFAEQVYKRIKREDCKCHSYSFKPEHF